ncbi:MAG TPA: choice-of-anchor Q domain-containing protein, partial [Anaerolineales bacterium]|nr:choice-of-anchor Q domain-containing protein [Anaerolineales bacterium]
MSKQLVRVNSIFLILTILLAQFGVRPAAADVIFEVNSTADMVDALPGDGLCKTITGDCTLRAALQEANELEGADTISIPAGVYTLTIEGAEEDEAATGDLDITDSLTIIGAGMEVEETVIDANGLDRAFQVYASLDLSDVMIKNGFANPGGAVLVNSYASINRVTFDDNRTTSLDQPNETGGAVFVTVEASADITESQFINNFAYFGGGAIANTFGSSFSINDSTFVSNSSVHGGGAIYPNGGSATINSSTFVDNSANTGGAIHSNADFVEITNSTFVENSAVNHGAIDSRVGTVIVNNSTFSANRASGFGDTLGSQPEQGGELQVGNSILSGDGLDNCEGSIEDLGNNLSWPIENNCPGMQADPLLDTLANNGGSTETMALLTGSPAIDAGDTESCAQTDQRGVARPQGETCDIGAFESQTSNIFVVTNTSDSGTGSLRQAILDANAAPNSINGPDQIHFNIPSENVNVIAPSSALPAITEPVVIDGYTQSGSSPNTLSVGNNASIQIELDGNSCDGICGQALLLSSGGSTIKGLAIHGNFNNGIEVNGSGNTIAGNFFGLKANGAADGVLASGIYLNNTSGNKVGGTTSDDRNVISANRDGIFIAAGAADATDNIITGNYIGTDLSGMEALGNSQRGIFVGSFGFTASGNSISGNVISGNGRFGVLLRDANVTENSVTGNLVGLDASGEEALPNGNNDAGDDGLSGTSATAGIYVGGQDNTIGGTGRVAAGNTIAFNSGAGIHVG